MTYYLKFFCKECGSSKVFNTFKELLTAHSTLKDYPDLIGIIVYQTMYEDKEMRSGIEVLRV